MFTGATVVNIAGDSHHVLRHLDVFSGLWVEERRLTVLQEQTADTLTQSCSAGAIKNNISSLGSVPIIQQIFVHSMHYFFPHPSYIILLYPDDEDEDCAYVCNITPWLTPHSN